MKDIQKKYTGRKLMESFYFGQHTLTKEQGTLDFDVQRDINDMGKCRTLWPDRKNHQLVKTLLECVVMLKYSHDSPKFYLKERQVLPYGWYHEDCTWSWCFRFIVFDYEILTLQVFLIQLEFIRLHNRQKEKNQFDLNKP